MGNKVNEVKVHFTYYILRWIFKQEQINKTDSTIVKFNTW